jgi:hypothetical protein
MAKQIALLEKRKLFIERRLEEIRRQIEVGGGSQYQGPVAARHDGPALAEA